MKKKDQQLNIRVSKDTINRLVNLQATFKTSKSDIIETMLLDYETILQQNKSIAFIQSQQQVIQEIVNILATTKQQIDELSKTVKQQSALMATILPAIRKLQ